MVGAVFSCEGDIRDPVRFFFWRVVIFYSFHRFIYLNFPRPSVLGKRTYSQPTLNRRGTEPWRFIKLGKEPVGKVVALREKLNRREYDDSNSSEGAGAGPNVDGGFVSWTQVPHWIVVTYARSPPGSGPDGKFQQREDFKSTCCAVQNFLLSMWSEGIGTKWTDGPIQRTKEFADICGIDLEKEKVAGVIWYGFAKGGLKGAEPKWRRKGVEEVLDILP